MGSEKLVEDYTIITKAMIGANLIIKSHSTEDTPIYLFVLEKEG